MSTEWIVFVRSIKYVVTITKELTYSSPDRQLADISEGSNTDLHEYAYFRKINLQKTLEISEIQRTSELHERTINSKKRSHCHLFQRRM